MFKGEPIGPLTVERKTDRRARPFMGRQLRYGKVEESVRVKICEGFHSWGYTLNTEVGRAYSLNRIPF